MAFQTTGLPIDLFRPMFGLADSSLEALGARRIVADDDSGFPCRVTLDDAAAGETVLLLNFEHQPADTPFRSRHAIFVREQASKTYGAQGPLPSQLRRRLLSLRAFDAQHMMIDADVIAGDQADDIIERMLADERVAYLHAHYAKQGCYAARIDRVDS